MNLLDKIYQKAIDKKVENLFSLTMQNIYDLRDFGQDFEYVDGKKISIGWWKYQINKDQIHIIYKTSRRSFLFLHKAYINGIKITNGEIEYLTSNEIGEYD